MRVRIPSIHIRVKCHLRFISFISCNAQWKPLQGEGGKLEYAPDLCGYLNLSAHAHTSSQAKIQPLQY